MKKLCFIIVIITFSFQIYSQTWDWAISEPHPSYVQKTDIVITAPSGNTYVGGEEAYYSDFGIFLIKYDASGAKLWEKFYLQGVAVVSMATDHEGNLYAVMSARNIEGVTFEHGTGAFAKYDPSGNLIWIKQINYRLLLSPSTDINNNLSVTGSFTDTVYLENGYTLTCAAGDAKQFLGKFNTEGECIWVYQDDGGKHPLIVNSLGEMLAWAEMNFHTSVGQGINQINLDPANGNAYVAKYNASGSLQWVSQFLHTAITLDNTGNTYAFIPDHSDITNQSWKHNLLNKFDAFGNLCWSRLPLYIDQWFKLKMVADDRGDLLITGGFTGYITIGDTTIYDGGNTRAFVAKIDSSGVLKWVTTSAGVGGCGAKDISVRENEIFIIGDIGGGTSSFGLTTVTESNGIFVAKLTDHDVVSVNEKSEPVYTFWAYPNPSGSVFILSCNSLSCKKLYINVKNELGQNVFSSFASNTTGQYNLKIDLTRDPKGLYFIEIIADGKRSVKKVVLQ